MLKKTLAAVALAAASLASFAPTATADPSNPFGPSDVTGYFVTPLDPAAFDPNDNTALLLSPWGTSQPIFCSSFHGKIYNCTQTDPNGGAHSVGNLEDIFWFMNGYPVYVTWP